MIFMSITEAYKEAYTLPVAKNTFTLLFNIFLFKYILYIYYP